MFTNTNTSFRLIEALTGVQMTEGKLALWLQPILKQLQSACFYYFWWEKRVSLWKTIARQKTIVFCHWFVFKPSHAFVTVDCWWKVICPISHYCTFTLDPCWCQALQTDITNRVGIKHWLPSLMDSWSKSSGAIHRHSTHNLHPRDPRRRRQSQSCFAYLCYLPSAQPGEVWWAGLGVWRRRPSSDPVSCVTLQAARAAAHQSPDHLPTFTLRCPVFRAQRRPLYFCAWRNPYNPSSIRWIAEGAYRGSDTYQRWHIASHKRVTSHVAKSEWHLWRHCPTQFVINHPDAANIFLQTSTIWACHPILQTTNVIFNQWRREEKQLF